MKNEGEWMREGTEVVKIVRLDRIRVRGKLDASQCSPEMVDGCSVSILVKRTGLGVQEIQGKVVYARQQIQLGRFEIFVEADNQKTEKGYWILNPGAIVDMVIHLD